MRTIPDGALHCRRVVVAVEPLGSSIMLSTADCDQSAAAVATNGSQSGVVLLITVRLKDDVVRAQW
jgi:uncharacterized lipoprotein YehR (DUF1307 family)